MIFTKIPSTAIMSILAENESGPLDSTLCVFMGVEFTIILHGLHYGNFTFPRGSISPKGMADNRIDFFYLASVNRLRVQIQCAKTACPDQRGPEKASWDVNLVDF